jgi:hypothetical protein
MVFAAREPAPDFQGLPDLVVGGPREADARMLLAAVVRSPLDRRVMERIVAETRGNPLRRPWHRASSADGGRGRERAARSVRSNDLGQ